MSPRRAKAVRGRVGDDPATALREHLIEVAERLLAERQVSSITTRDIARAAEVSDGVLYNYFDGKHGLVIAALLRRHERLLERFTADLPEPGTGTVKANLIAYGRAVFDLVAAALPLAGGLLGEPALLHGYIAAIHRPPFGPHQILQPITDYLAAERRLGRLPEVDPEAVTTMLFGAALVLATSVHVGGRPVDEVVEEIPRLVDTLCLGSG
jgi:AcrR family transcriptional regulator